MFYYINLSLLNAPNHYSNTEKMLRTRTKRFSELFAHKYSFVSSFFQSIGLPSLKNLSVFGGLSSGKRETNTVSFNIVLQPAKELETLSELRPTFN
jgi:hypothetical protein